jgi:hypothetical protein
MPSFNRKNNIDCEKISVEELTITKLWIGVSSLKLNQSYHYYKVKLEIDDPKCMISE